MFRVSSEALRELAHSWFPFGVHLIEGFFQTVRRMDTLSRQRESLIALGELAARLMHEINNPASAAARAVDALHESCDTLLTSLTRLGERSMSPENFIALDTLRREIDPSRASTDPLTLADAEETLSSWLHDRGVAEAWRIAPPLAAAGVDIAWCERAALVLQRETIEPGLDWVAGTIATQTLLSEMKDATTRVSALVNTVKSYAQVDRASLQLIDVTEGIESTLAMMGHKLGDGIGIVRDYAAALPRIEANPGELNQVWTNLIDNAVDAMEGIGTLQISTRIEGEQLVVEVGDTGVGMSSSVQTRAFEPFFTTKEVGKGTGLGLDISRRIVVDRHHGEITIGSTLQGTVLTVRLPRPEA